MARCLGQPRSPQYGGHGLMLSELIVVIAIIVLLAPVGLVFGGADDGNRVSVLVCDSIWIPKESIVDEQLRQRLEAEGFDVAVAHMEELSDELVRKFNVVIMNTPVFLGATGGTIEERAAKWAVLERFLRNGGGLLCIWARAVPPSREGSGDPTIQFLTRAGLWFLDAAVIETDKNKWVLPEESLPITAIDHGRFFGFARTTNILHPHPVTDGVNELWYPMGWMYEASVRPIEVDKQWTVLVRGSDTAQAVIGRPEGTVERVLGTAPAFMAARLVDQGRLLVLSSWPTFWTQGAYHRLWAYGFVYEHGDGFRLLCNALRWLAEPSQRSGVFGGYRPPKREEKPKSAEELEKLAGQLVEKPAPPRWQKPDWQGKIFKGLIGAHTTLSDGFGTVDQFCSAARAAGYDFIVFTEELEQFDEEEWPALVEACKRNSDDKFLAIPGIAFYTRTSRNGAVRYVAFGIQEYPKQFIGSYSERHQRHINAIHLFLFREEWRPIVLVAPHRNPRFGGEPWFQKFYTGFAVFTYAADKLVDDATDWYLDRMGNQYNSVPIAVHEVYCPQDVARAVSGVQTYVWARSLKEVPQSLRHAWYANPQGAFVSSGPVLKELWLEHPNDQFSQRWRMHIDLQSEAELERVEIWDGRRLYRCFRPHSRQFNYVLEGWHDQQRFFVLVARDKRGGVLVSPTVWTSDVQHSLVMCTDMQNTMEGVYLWHPKRKQRVPVALTMFNDVTGWDELNFGLPLPQDEVTPPGGFDWSPSGIKISLSPGVDTTVGHEGGVAQMDIHFANKHMAVEDRMYYMTLLPGSWSAPMRLIRGEVRQWHPTPRLYGYDTLIVRSRLKCLQHLEFERPHPDALAVGLLGGRFTGGVHRWQHLGRDGQVKVEGKFGDQPSSSSGRLSPGECLIFGPGFFGGLVIYPLSGAVDYVVRHDGSFVLGLAKSAPMTKDQQMEHWFLLLRTPASKDDRESAVRFARDFGLVGGQPAYHISVKGGQVARSGYPLVLSGTNGGLVVEFRDRGLPAGLPVFVKGLNDNWDAVVWQQGRGVIEHMGVREGIGYYQFSESESEGGTYFLGHPVVCSDLEVRLQLVELGEKKLTLRLHNPRARRVVTQIATSSSLPWLKPFRKKISIGPNQTLQLSIKQ